VQSEEQTRHQLKRRGFSVVHGATVIPKILTITSKSLLQGRKHQKRHPILEKGKRRNFNLHHSNPFQ
jgi:hypothetical protein